MSGVHRRLRPRPIRTRFLAPEQGFAPIAAINTTPLIDMMLVLIIMFIVAIPMREHKVPLDLPRPDRSSAPPPVHRLVVDAAGRTFWDGAAIDSAGLRARLAAMAADPAEPSLEFLPDGAARYARIDTLLAEIRRAGIRRMGIANAPFAGALAP